MVVYKKEVLRKLKDGANNSMAIKDLPMRVLEVENHSILVNSVVAKSG